jgi:futalosine hydrolase
MDILVVASTVQEIEPFLEYYRLKAVHMNMFSGKIKTNKVDCLVTGIGMVAVTYHLTKAIGKKKYKLIINAGIGGSFKNELNPGSVVEVVNEQFADFGIDDNGIFRAMFEEKFIERNDFPFRSGMLTNPVKHHFSMHLPDADGVTVNMSSGSNERIKAVKEKFNPEVETMEGAAVFYVALQQQIPFVEIRAISNMVEPRDKKNWKISLAIDNLNSTLIGIFGKI